MVDTSIDVSRTRARKAVSGSCAEGMCLKDGRE
jgi:hypothetical protein